ncbi:MAG: PAS domain S-box protein [Ignavibacteriaceae bacterium]|nr:PAS domain S-box protein [Ignavibacteriaceae bacterium]
MSKDEIQNSPKANILIVDDELIVAMDIKQSLQFAGYHVPAIAVSAQEALQKVKEVQPDLILMDIILKGPIDGIDTAKTIIETHNLPIVFISASSDKPTFERAKLVGHYGYLIKPIEHRDLINSIEIALYKHQMEEKLRISEMNYRQLFNNAPIPFQSADENGILININFAWERLLGYNKEDVIGTSIAEYMTHESKEKFPEIFQKFRESGILTGQECEMITKSGTILSIVADGNVIYDDDGNFLQTQCTITNVTEQRAAQKLIQLAESRYKAMIGSSIDGFAVIDTTGKFVEVNESYSRIIGYSVEEMSEKYINDIEFIESPEETQQRIERIISQGHERFESKHISKGGNILDIEASVIFSKEHGQFLCFFQDITDKKKSAETTLTTLERLFALTTSIEQGILYENEGRQIEFANMTFCNYFGIPSPEMLLGVDCDAAAEMSKIIFEDPDEFIKVIKKTIKAQKTVLNHELYLVDGRVFERDYIPVKRDGKKTGNYWVYRDITKRKQNEAELAQAEELLRYANEASTDGIWDWNLATGNLYWNKRIYEMIGYEENEFPPSFEAWLSFIHPEDREVAWSSIQQQIKERGRFSQEFRFRCKDGSYIWMIGKGKAVELNEDGSARRMVGTHTDVTKRKTAELKLAEREEHYRTITEYSFDLITLINSDGIYEFCNNAYKSILGYEPEELIGTYSFDLVHPDERGPAQENWIKLLENKSSEEIVLSLISKNGEIHKIYHRVKTITTENNEIKVFIVAQDITAKSRLEELRKEKDELLHKLAENVPGVIYQFKVTGDGKMSFPFATDAIYDVYEVFPDQINEDSSIILNILHPEDLERVMQSIADSSLNLTIWECNYRVILPTKGVRWLYGIAKPQRLEDGGTLWHGFITDVTERINFENELNSHLVRNQIFMEKALDGILIFNQQHEIIEVNQRYVEMSGYSKSELLKMHTWDFVVEMSEEEIRKGFERFEEINLKFESTHRKKDGSLMNVEVSATGAIINDEAFMFTIVRDITEKIQSEKLLKESSERLEAFFKQSIDGFFFMMLDEPVEWNDSVDKEAVLDYVFAHQKITKINQAMLDQYGAVEEDFLTLTPNDFFAHDVQHGREVWREFFDKGKLHIDTREKRFDGSDMIVEGDYICLYDEKERIIGHFGVQRDVTKERINTQQLKQSELMLSESQKAARIGYYDFDIRRNTWTSSDMLNQIFGIDESYQKSVESWYSLIHPQDLNIMSTYLPEIFKRQKTEFNKEYRIIRKNDNSIRWVHGLGTLEYDADKNPVRMTGAIQDITERKEIETEIVSKNERLSALLAISEKVSKTLDVQTILQNTADSIASLNDFTTSAIYQLKGKNIVLKATTPPLPKNLPEFLLNAELDKHPHIKRAMFRGEPVIIRDSEFEDLTEEEARICKERELRTILYLPLQTSEGILGVLIAGSAKQIEISNDNVEICETIANFAAVALEKARLYEFSQKNIAELEHQISETKRVEAELRERESLLRTLVDTAPFEIWVRDMRGVCILENEALVDHWGSLVGKTPQDSIVSADQLNLWLSNNERAMRGEIVNEEVIYSINNKPRYFQSIVSPIKDGKKIIGITGFNIDLTEQKIAEEAIRKSEERYRTLAADLPVYVSTFAPDYTLTFVNNALADITGRTPQELIGLKFTDFIPKEHVEILKNEFQKINFENPISTYEQFYLAPDGKEYWQEWTNRAFFNHEGNIISYQSVGRDITERKNAEKLLQQIKQNYETFYNTIDEFLFVLDEAGNIINVNQSVYNRLGYSSEELLGLSVLMVHPENRRDEAQMIVGEMLQGKREFCPIPLITKSGYEIPVETRITHGEWNGKPALFGVSKDISQLRYSEEKFSKVFYLNPFPAGLSELETGKYIELNEAFYKFFGYTPEEALGKNPMELGLFSEESRNKLLEKVDRDGRVINAETILFTKSGEAKNVLISGEIILLQDKKVRYTIVQDITELKAAESELVNQFEELNRFNKLMVGRENKMLELKQEINELLIKHGAKPKYQIDDVN